MNLVIVSASHRAESQSFNVGEYLKFNAKQFESISHIELAMLNLPFWDGTSDKGESWAQVKSSLEEADAIIAITPEWNGMASPLLKNFLMMCDLDMTDNKPIMYVAVSSGIGGTYPIAELKMDGGKNNGLIPISEHLIIRGVEGFLNPEIESSHEKQLRLRIEYSLEMLARFSEALSNLRVNLKSNPIKNRQLFSYGM
ncbi:NADPH-dependent oxidoreductase [Shewanella sp. OPT22]|nr:NADPH-dependent oxidoreductase [Shewanella sp. OPT22]